MPDAIHYLQAFASAAPSLTFPVLVVAAHPDDETIALGGQLKRLETLRLIHVTDGAPRDGTDAMRAGFPTLEDYASTRRQELAAALRLAGHDAASCCACLGIADQQAAGKIGPIALALVNEITTNPAEIVITHPYEGGHPDHDACAIAVQAACDLLGDRAPAAIEMTSYHADGAGLAQGCFLAAPDTDEIVLPLSRDDQDRKQAMLACFNTQRETLALFPPSAAERLRRTPRIDATQPPHPGTLFYERMPWGMDGSAFRRHASAALACLDLAKAA